MINTQSFVSINIEETTSHSLIFHQDEIRKGMRILGREVQKEAQSYVGKSARSKAGEFPGSVTGRLSKSIKFKVSRAGFLVVVRPEKTAAYGSKEFYPAFLNYGVKRGKKGKKSEASEYRIAPRKNYMKEAQDAKADRVRQVIFAAVKKGLTVA